MGVATCLALWACGGKSNDAKGTSGAQSTSGGGESTTMASTRGASTTSTSTTDGAGGRFSSTSNGGSVTVGSVTVGVTTGVVAVGGSGGAGGADTTSGAAGGAGEANLSCDDGRAGWQALYDELYTYSRQCFTDNDCIYASFSDECHSICAFPLNPLRAGAFAQPLYAYAAANCQACEPEGFSKCPSGSPPDVFCDNGTCQYVTPWE